MFITRSLSVCLISLSLSSSSMLCVVFIRFSHDWAIDFLKSNIAYAGSSCTVWGLMPYFPSSAPMVNAIESYNQSLQDHAYNYNTSIMYILTEYSNTNDKTRLLKGCLYTNLLPYLSSYDRVWLLDEDFTLEHFNFTEYFYYLNLPSGQLQYTMISQALVTGQIFYEHLNYYSPVWIEQRSLTTTNHTGPDPVSGSFFPAFVSDAATSSPLIAFPTNFIEIQAPILNTTFLIWFLNRIQIPVIHTLSTTTLDKCHDYGFPNTWCYAAHQYLLEIGQNYDPSIHLPCAVIVGTSYTTHHDKKTIGVGAKREAFHSEGERVKLIYQAMFPQLWAYNNDLWREKSKWLYSYNFSLI